MGLSDSSRPAASPEPARHGRVAAAYAAARLYFEEEMSQADIARRLSVSRSTVSRLIAEARESGIVRIEIRPPIAESELAGELASALGLRRVVVTPDVRAERPVALAGSALAEIAALDLQPGQVLLMSWGRAVWEIASARMPPLRGVHIVPAVGGMKEPERPFRSNEIVHRAAEHSGAIAHPLHAPAVPSAGLRRALLADEGIAAVVSLWDRIDAAIVGIGVPPGQPGSYTPLHVSTDAARPALTRAAGDIATRYFDLKGRPVSYPSERRLLGVDRGQLQRAATVIGVAAGENKHRAIVGAARARLVHVLVTDAPTAASALELAEATA
ncbi:MAG TPA: sugar-binding domain-containing protein [Solirubrobacteraceae bacterium]|jgi:DNA-binding transcriptional regulator LsrR (DeoR family)